jgi:serine/threonine protein kinase
VIFLFALLPEESRWKRKLSDNHEDLADQMMKDSGVRLEMLIFRFPILLASWERAVMGQYTRLCTRTESRCRPGPSGHRPAGDLQGDLHYAAVPMLVKNTDLWIVMKYCGGGSVSDIVRLKKKILTEEEIATVLSHSEGSRVLAPEEENPP